MTNKKLTVALDLDNTTADFTGGFGSYLTTRTDTHNGRTLPTHSVYDLVKCGWFNTETEFTSLFNTAEMLGLYRNLNPFPRAIETLHSLHAAGHSIIVVTARSDAYYSDTMMWLHAYGIRYDRIIHTNDKATVDADVFLEDADYQIRNLRKAGKRVVVHSRPYNQHFVGERFNDWSEVPSLLTA